MSENNIESNNNTYLKVIDTRKKNKMTQAELAKKAGISLKTLSRYENGEKISFNSEKKLLITLEIDNAQSLENYAEKNKYSFDNQAEEYNKFEFIIKKEYIEKIINAGYPYKNKKALDLGCGTGMLAIETAKYAKEVYALDISKAMTEKLKKDCIEKKINNIIAVEGDAHNLQFEDNTFDTVITRLAVHHFANPHIIFSEIKRVLKNFGEVILVDIVASEDKEEAILQDTFNKIRDFSHNRFYTLNEIKKFLKDNSFIEAKIQTWKTEREFYDWISLSNFKDPNNLLFNIMRGFALNNIDIGANLRLENNEIRFDQKMVLIKVTNIK